VRLLLDTQVALWWLTASKRLSPHARTLMSESSCAISVASIWEVDLKHRLGKLPVPPARFRDEMRLAGATVLPVTDEHVLTAVDLAKPHNDPFDRLLLSVATAEHLILLTADEALIALGSSEPRLPVRGA
jgi:PIN domain nuclease of toxin-antitoxin system